MRYDVAQIIRRRLVLGWTKSKVAGKAGVSHTTVSRVEAGEFQSPDTISRIARALKLDMEDLVIDDDTEPVER